MLYGIRPRGARALPACLLLLTAGLGLAAQASGLNPTAARAFAFQPRLGAPGARIKVTWERPSHIPSSLVLGSTVWRSDQTGELQVVGGTDGDTNHAFLDSEAQHSGFAYTGTPNGDAGTRSQITAPGIVPGQLYTYQISMAFNSGLLDKNGDGQPDNTQYMTPLSTGSARVTAIAAPLIVSVAGGGTSGVPQVNPAAVDLSWQQTPGADSYVVWASSTPSFRSGRRIVSGHIGTVPVDLGGPPTVSATISLARGRLRTRSGIVYLSVGAWNSADRERPRPFGAIFSPPVAVQPQTTPPPPPG